MFSYVLHDLQRVLAGYEFEALRSHGWAVVGNFAVSHFCSRILFYINFKSIQVALKLPVHTVYMQVYPYAKNWALDHIHCIVMTLQTVRSCDSTSSHRCQLCHNLLGVLMCVWKLLDRALCLSRANLSENVVQRDRFYKGVTVEKPV